MNNTIYTPSTQELTLSKTFEKIRHSGCKTIKEIKSYSLDLYNELHLSLYDYVCNKAFNTVRALTLLGQYKNQFGDHDVNALMDFEVTVKKTETAVMEKAHALKVIGLKDGDQKHNFYLKMFSPKEKGTHKGEIWLDVLFSETPYDFWIPTIKKSIVNGILDDLRAVKTDSIDRKVSDDESSISISDMITASTYNDEPITPDEEAISNLNAYNIGVSLIHELINKPDELVAFAFLINNSGLCKCKDLYHDMIKIGNARDILNKSLYLIRNICPKLDITPYITSNIDCSRIDRILQMEASSAKAELSRCADRAKKKAQTNPIVRLYK